MLAGNNKFHSLHWSLSTNALHIHPFFFLKDKIKDIKMSYEPQNEIHTNEIKELDSPHVF